MKEYFVSNSKDRRKSWLSNALRATWMRMFNFYRRRDIWVFGCWGGKRYDDNSRYLFEFVTKNYPNIKAYWITCSEEIKEKISQYTSNVLLAGEKQTKRLMCKAGVAFYTNGLDDFGSNCYLYGAYLVNLNHSIAGIKRDLFLKDKYKSHNILYYFKKIKDFLFDSWKYDCSTVSSVAARQNKMETHDHYNEKMYAITGMPRNDLLRNKGGFTPKKPECFLEGFHYVAILPTFRPYDNTVVREMIDGLQNNSDFLRFIDENDVVIYFKLHFADRSVDNITIKSDHILLLSAADIESTQELLYYSDVLVTDYSSVCMDFSLTGRPVVLFAPDYEQYNQLHGIADEWLQLYRSDRVLKNIDELAKGIIAACQNGKESCYLSNLLRNKYESTSIVNSCYSENVVREIMHRIKIV